MLTNCTWGHNLDKLFKALAVVSFSYSRNSFYVGCMKQTYCIQGDTLVLLIEFTLPYSSHNIHLNHQAPELLVLICLFSALFTTEQIICFNIINTSVYTANESVEIRRS